jgi:hypothetical protein
VYFHGHVWVPFIFARNVLWLMESLANEFDIDLATDFVIQKLRRRYPEGFSTERSVNREI